MLWYPITHENDTRQPVPPAGGDNCEHRRTSFIHTRDDKRRPARTCKWNDRRLPQSSVLGGRQKPYCPHTGRQGGPVQGSGGKRQDGEISLAGTFTRRRLRNPFRPINSKKNVANIVLKGAAKINALVERAAESVERDGIACTSELEHTLFDEMNGLCREVMSALLKAGAESHCDYEPEAGERNGGTHGKRIVTLFGETPAIRRRYYYNKDTQSGHYPFDDRLGLVGRYTPAVTGEALRYAASHPYNEASGEFSKHHSFVLSADSIREIVEATAKDASDFAKFGGNSPKDDADGRVSTVCVMADGTGIPLRKQCLKGVKGKNGRAKTREVKAGAIFMASKTSDNEPHRNLDTTTYVATTHRKEKFGKMLRAEFDRRFGRTPETVLYVTDGGKWLHSIHESDFPFAIEILDVYHAVEHLKPLMAGLGIKENSKEWKYRLHYWSECIKTGKIQNVLDYIWKHMKARLGKDAMREYKYYRSNAGRMKYDKYRANGWFVGSGVIESGCKTVIGQRFKQSGMIWSLRGVKALLPVRTLLKSSRLDEYIHFRVRDLSQVKCAS